MSRNIRHGYEYAQAVTTYTAIQDWCKENDITDYNSMISKMENEKLDWYTFLSAKSSAKIFFLNYFRSMHRYDHITEARKQDRYAARGTKSHDRRPVPCICTDNGMEFRSFHAAGKWAGVDGTLISDCCYGVRPSVKGLHFKLKENYKKKATEK